LAAAAKIRDPATGWSKAGSHLQSHGQRPGSAFPRQRGSRNAINAAADKIVDDIVMDPRSTIEGRHHRLYGHVLEVRAPDGRGVRFSSNGSFIGFLEPPQP
jgi:filamentous hemagglutinin